MAVIPSIADKLPVVPNAPTRVTPVQGAGLSSDAAVSFDNNLTQIANQELDQQDQFAYAKARAAFLTKKTELESSLQNDQDWATLPTRYKASISQIANDAATSLPTPRLQEKFKVESGLDAADGLGKINSFANGARQDQGRADLNSLLDTAKDNGLSDPTNSAAYVKNAQLAIQGARSQNLITAQEAEAQGRKFSEDYGKGYAETLDPDTRVRGLAQRLGIGTGAAGQTGDIKAALIGQESGGRPNVSDSPTGAMGIGQIEPATWARFAKPGEDPHNPKDNAAVSGRYVDYLSSLPNVQGDPARIAVGYYSGEGNISPAGNSTPFIRDVGPRAGVKGPKTSQYVADILGRMTPSTGTQLTTAPLKTGSPLDFIPPDDAHVMLEQAIRQRHADASLVLEENKAAQSLQDRQTANDLMTKLYTGQGTTQDIIKSNLSAFGENSKSELLDIASKLRSGTTDPSTWQSLFERIGLPQSDPRKITDEGQLRPYVGSGLSFDDYRKFSSLLSSNDTEEGRTTNDMRKGMYDIAKSALVKANPISGLYDPNDALGRQKLQQFMALASRKEAEASQKHIPLTELYDPNSKSYLGRYLPQFIPNMQDAMSQGSITQTFAPPALAQPKVSIPKRSPGETPEQYLKRIGAMQ